jgi:hypothetical protein
VYGFIMLDMGYDSGQMHPDWFDVIRTTKMPSYENEFGEDGNFYASVRQTRLGGKAGAPTKLGELKTQFEFEPSARADAGQTTIRLRHAYGELGAFGAGQTWSPFMDPDVFPNSLEYWGPTGMVFFRNVQVRWTVGEGPTLALERRARAPTRVSPAGSRSMASRPFPAAGSSAAFRTGTGAISSGRHPPADEVGRPQRRPVDLSGTPPAGASTRVQPQAPGTSRLRWSTARDPELHERRAGGRGDRTTSRTSRPVDGKARPCWAWRSSTSTGTTSGRARSATRCRHRQLGRASLQEGPYAGELLNHPAPTGPWDPKSREAQELRDGSRRRPGSSSRPSTTSNPLEASDEPKPLRSAPASRGCSSRSAPAQAQTPAEIQAALTRPTPSS